MADFGEPDRLEGNLPDLVAMESSRDYNRNAEPARLKSQPATQVCLII